MKATKRTEFKDYVEPTGQTWMQRNINWQGVALVVFVALVVGLIVFLLAWGQ